MTEKSLYFHTVGILYKKKYKKIHYQGKELIGDHSEVAPFVCRGHHAWMTESQFQWRLHHYFSLLRRPRSQHQPRRLHSGPDQTHTRNHRIRYANYHHHLDTNNSHNLQKGAIIMYVIMHTLCGIFSIFPSLRFYVKSILEILEVLKMPFL